MSANISRIMVGGILLFFTVSSGMWLSNSGKPINVAIFTVHKLIALLTVIFIAVTIYQLQATIETRTVVRLVAVVVTGLVFLCLFVSGALLSLGKPISGAILTIHQVAPLLAVISTAATLYLVTNAQS